MDSEEYFCTILRLHESGSENMLLRRSRSVSRSLFSGFRFGKRVVQAPCFWRHNPSSSSAACDFCFGKTSGFHRRPRKNILGIDDSRRRALVYSTGLANLVRRYPENFPPRTFLEPHLFVSPWNSPDGGAGLAAASPPE